MTNRDTQIQHLIQEATERVAEEGRNADMEDLMLACFGYLVHEVNRPQWWSIKRVVPLAFTGGVAFGSGVLAGLARWFGIGMGS